MEAVLSRPSATDDSSRMPQHAPCRVLVAHDRDGHNERGAADALRAVLESHGFDVVAASSLPDAVNAASVHPVHVALVDIDAPKGRGTTTPSTALDLIEALRRIDQALPIVAMLPAGSCDLAVEAMRRGAREVIEKPWHEGRLLAVIRCQAEIGRSMRRTADLEAELQRLQSGASADSSASFADMRLLDVEGTLVRQALSKFGGNISRTARALGLSRSALYRRLERHKVAN